MKVDQLLRRVDPVLHSDHVLRHNLRGLDGLVARRRRHRACRLAALD